jgi:hypothetical protein
VKSIVADSQRGQFNRLKGMDENPQRKYTGLGQWVVLAIKRIKAFRRRELIEQCSSVMRGIWGKKSGLS